MQEGRIQRNDAETRKLYQYITRNINGLSSYLTIPRMENPLHQKITKQLLTLSNQDLSNQT